MEESRLKAVNALAQRSRIVADSWCAADRTPPLLSAISLPCFGLDCSLAQASAQKVACKYGAQCYRRNPVRQRQPAACSPEPVGVRWDIARPSPCGNQLALLHRCPLSQVHFKEFSHPGKAL